MYPRFGVQSAYLIEASGPAFAQEVVVLFLDGPGHGVMILQIKGLPQGKLGGDKSALENQDAGQEKPQAFWPPGVAPPPVPNVKRKQHRHRKHFAESIDVGVLHGEKKRTENHQENQPSEEPDGLPARPVAFKIEQVSD